MKRFFRNLHRWLGLLMALQIIAWMASGLYFSIYPIEEIRGEHLIRKPERVDADALAQMESPHLAALALDDHFGRGWRVKSISLMNLSGQVLWRVEGWVNGVPFRRLVNGTGTRVFPSLNEDEATQVARDWLHEAGDVVSVDWLETAEPDAEFRGRPLPLWKISFSAPESVNLYLDPWTREILASRNTRWRIFDFLWMLHVLDFETRDDFNHPLIQIAAVLGLVVALSGVIFWTLTTTVFRRKNRLRGSTR
jgi:uncharacterized iron-regulated membrane protein